MKHSIYKISHKGRKYLTYLYEKLNYIQLNICFRLMSSVVYKGGLGLEGLFCFAWSKALLQLLEFSIIIIFPSGENDAHIFVCTEDTIPMSSWSQFWCPQMSAASVFETDKKKSAETSSYD